jgi:hypothetical protein
MDELALLKELADRTPLPTADDLAPARERLTATMSAATSAPPVIETPRRAARRRRLWLSGAAVVGLAAAITGVVALGGLEPVGVAPPKASAAEILRQAADAARTLPDTPPRPDQFVYTKTHLADGSTRETWLSADGTHDGFVKQQGEMMPLPGCRDGRAQVIKGADPVPGMFEPCEPLPAYVPDLPTDAAGMREYLLGLPTGDGKVNSLGKNIHFVVAENYVSPASLAALFEAVAGLDGLTVVPDAQDGAGRPGVGVSWSHEGFTVTMVFDEQSHAFLGMAGWDAIVQQAVVDVAGQQP